MATYRIVTASDRRRASSPPSRSTRWRAVAALVAVGSIAATCSNDSATTEETVEPAVATVVAGTTTFTVSEGTVTSNDDGSSSSRNGAFTEEVVSDDQRVAGVAEGTWEADRWEADVSDGALVQWGTGELTNDRGSWQGDYAGIRTAETGDVLARWWEGTGDYEGLTFFMWITDSTASPWEWTGVVYPGRPPLNSEPRVDAATESIENAGATLVSGTVGFDATGGTSSSSGDGPGRWRSWTFSEEVIGDDERINGVMAGTWLADIWSPQAAVGSYAQVQWGAGALTSDGGSWEGAYSAMYERENGDVRVLWWTGADDYEGHTLFMWATAEPTARRRSGSPSGSAVYEWTGLIYPGAPPFVETATGDAERPA